MNEQLLRQGRILLVDDEVSSLRLLESVLDRLRFRELRKLLEPERILEVFDEFQPDLIITDLEMPKLDGFRLIELLRHHLPSDACLPILVITGTDAPHVKQRALQAGATDILLKPVESSEMLMRVRNLLQTRMQYLEIEKQNRALESKVAERTTELEKALAELQASQRQVVQQERFHAFSEMAGGVCHDFNNSLMAIIGYSELLLMDPSLLDERDSLTNYLKTINTAGRDASQVVSRLRDFYRPREENDVFSAIDVNDILEEVVPLTKPKWHDHALRTGRSICLELELQKVPLAHGNCAELREALMNLIFNAVDALPDGGTITLRSAPTPTGVRVDVADNGTGMSAEVRQRCLEPFFSTKGEHGTGLGLAMVFGIIRRHEGSLDIDTAPGAGTTFRISLPCHHHTSISPEDATLTSGRSLSVLVVDDEPAIREVVSGYLRGDGHRVITAENGPEAIEHVMAHDIDVVITDRAMPGMDGLELAGAVRCVDSAKSIILLTGFFMEPEEQPDTIDFVLYKPLVPAELRTTLRALAVDGR